MPFIIDVNQCCDRTKLDKIVSDAFRYIFRKSKTMQIGLVAVTCEKPIRICFHCGARDDEGLRFAKMMEEAFRATLVRSDPYLETCGTCKSWSTDEKPDDETAAINGYCELHKIKLYGHSLCDNWDCERITIIKELRH